MGGGNKRDKFPQARHKTTFSTARQAVAPPPPPAVKHAHENEEALVMIEEEIEGEVYPPFNTFVLYVIVVAVAEYAILQLQIPFFSYLLDALGIAGADDCAPLDEGGF